MEVDEREEGEASDDSEEEKKQLREEDSFTKQESLVGTGVGATLQFLMQAGGAKQENRDIFLGRRNDFKGAVKEKKKGKFIIFLFFEVFVLTGFLFCFSFVIVV
jgi:hypothetical protein